MDQNVQPEAEPRIAAYVLKTTPPWLVSLVVHMVALIVLALLSLAQVEESTGLFVTAAAVQPLEEDLQELAEFEAENLEELEEFQQTELTTSIIDVGVIAFGDVSAPVEFNAVSEIGQISVSDSTIGEIGALFGKDGSGMSDIGDGLKAAASFFGAKSRGDKFVFVVDNSNSMTRGRFETAMIELIRTVRAMTPQQKFYVVFFSDTAYRMFHPDPAPALIPATDRNKQQLESWLGTVQMCLRTQGEEAIQAALSLNPDVIYILGDGAFTDRTTSLLTAPHNRRIPIHTLGMEVDPVGEKQLKAIADANHGSYRLVSASPQAKLLAKNNPIRRNRARGTVWGVKLPAVARKN